MDDMIERMNWSFLQRRNAKRKIDILAPYIRGSESVLDFGCGDLSLSTELLRLFPSLTITGTDIVDFGARPEGISFQRIKDQSLPFSDRSFDVVISYHVFHHTNNPSGWFAECVRVAKSTILFVEPVYRTILEIPGMTMMDWLFNAWKREKIPMHYAFHSFHWWRLEVEAQGCSVKAVTDVELLPRFFPTGRSLLFVADKK